MLRLHRLFGILRGRCKIHASQRVNENRAVLRWEYNSGVRVFKALLTYMRRRKRLRLNYYQFVFIRSSVGFAHPCSLVSMMFCLWRNVSQEHNRYRRKVMDVIVKKTEKHRLFKCLNRWESLIGIKGLCEVKLQRILSIWARRAKNSFKERYLLREFKERFLHNHFLHWLLRTQTSRSERLEDFRIRRKHYQMTAATALHYQFMLAKIHTFRLKSVWGAWKHVHQSRKMAMWRLQVLTPTLTYSDQP